MGNTMCSSDRVDKNKMDKTVVDESNYFCVIDRESKRQRIEPREEEKGHPSIESVEASVQKVVDETMVVSHALASPPASSATKTLSINAPVKSNRSRPGGGLPRNPSAKIDGNDGADGGERESVLEWFKDDTEECNADFQLFLLVDYIAALALFMKTRLENAATDRGNGLYLSLRALENERRAIMQVIRTASLTIFPRINEDILYSEDQIRSDLSKISTVKYLEHFTAELAAGRFRGVEEYMIGVSHILHYLYRKKEYIDQNYAPILVEVVTRLNRICQDKARASWRR